MTDTRQAALKAAFALLCDEGEEEHAEGDAEDERGIRRGVLVGHRIVLLFG